MPFPNEHAIKIQSEDKFTSFRRDNNKLGEGIDSIFGIHSDGNTSLHSIRFKKNKFTEQEAKQWLASHDFKTSGFEPATKADTADIVEVERFDKIALKGKAKRTDEGFIFAHAPIAREGIYSYRLSDGTTRRELVDSETLANQDSNDSLKMKSVTNNHPPEKFVTSKNSKFRSVGSVGETVKKEDSFLMASFSINDSDTVDDIGNGKKQLSPGYTVNLDMTPGTWNGQEYDAVQRNRKYNHLAIVDNARGGPELQLNIDHCDGEDGIINIINNKDDEESSDMEKYRIDNIGYEAAPEVINHIGKLNEKIDSLTSDVKAVSDEKSKIEAKADTLDEKVKELEKVDNQDIINKAVKARISLERNASKVIEDGNFDGISDEELMKKVILEKCKDDTAKKELSEKLDSKDTAYVEARFDTIIENLGDEAFADQKKIVINNDGKREPRLDSDKAREEMIQYNKNLWQEGAK